VKPFEERYTLRLPLGENELGSVWTAHDTETDASVAVVMLEVEAGDAVRARFRDHAERLMGVRHPNVVRALDRGDTAEGTPYLVVELLEGESLAARLAQSAVRVDRAVEWLAGAADGLGALHAAGIAHGDIEPGNVFLAGEGGKDTAKIIGLALNRVDARTGSDAASRTSLASLQQGYAYAAPEQLRGEVQASPAADLYSLGAVAFAVLAGRPPFVAPDPGSLLEAVRTRRPPGLGTVKRELAGYATILERALSAEPSRRFADGAAFARALKTCLLMSRPTASLELPAGPRSPLGESDSLDAAVPAKPSVAPKSLAAPRALGGRPLPKPAGGAATAQAAASAASTPVTPSAAPAEVSGSETIAAVAASGADSAPLPSSEDPQKEGEAGSTEAPIDVSESATMSASASSPAVPPADVAPTFSDQSEVTNVKAASEPDGGAARTASAPVEAPLALEDTSEVTTVKAASPSEEMELSEVSEVSEVSAVLIAPPAPPTVPRVDAPELRAKPREADPASPKRIATGDGVESVAGPVAEPVASRPAWLVPAALAAVVLLGVGVWSLTRGGASDDTAPETAGVAPAAEPPTSVAAEPPTNVAAEPDGVETDPPAGEEPSSDTPPEPAPLADALDAGAPAAEPAPEAAPLVIAPADPAQPVPLGTRDLPPPEPRTPRAASPAPERAAAPALARAASPAAVRGGAAAARPTKNAPSRAARPTKNAPPSAAAPRGATRTGARPTVISDPGF
jgi:serine/threonine-protein kinase